MPVTPTEELKKLSHLPDENGIALKPIYYNCICQLHVLCLFFFTALNVHVTEGNVSVTVLIVFRLMIQRAANGY